MTEKLIQDSVDSLIEVLSEDVQNYINSVCEDHLMEVVLDLNRPLEVRTLTKSHRNRDIIITKEHINKVLEYLGSFGDDNRAGIDGTLHRISCIRNRVGKIIGLTCRVGRTVKGSADVIKDLFLDGKSLLLLGPPGSGKSTKLREIARILSDEGDKRVMVIDTSNEIAGDGDTPHHAIGFSRRMQVPRVAEQHSVMIEAVENHTPEVIIIDEIGTVEEVSAARTIAERGVQLIATAHGSTLENLVLNPALNDLIGGIESVTLGDEEARNRGTQKTVLERRSVPTFDIVVELEGLHALSAYKDVAEAIDIYLRKRVLTPEKRYLDEQGRIVVEEDEPKFENLEGQYTETEKRIEDGTLKVFSYCLNRSEIDRAIKSLGFPMVVTRDMGDCDAVIAFGTFPGKKEMRRRNIPVYKCKASGYISIRKALKEAAEHFGVL